MYFDSSTSTPGGIFEAGAAAGPLYGETLTDAVLVPEVGRFAPAARAGFQVHFAERAPDMTAIGGRLPTDAGQVDVMVIDVAVMDGDWRREVGAEVIERILATLAEACGSPASTCPPTLMGGAALFGICVASRQAHTAATAHASGRRPRAHTQVPW